MKKINDLFKDTGPFTDEVIDNIFDVQEVSIEEFIESVQEVFIEKESEEEED